HHGHGDREDIAGHPVRHPILRDDEGDLGPGDQERREGPNRLRPNSGPRGRIRRPWTNFPAAATPVAARDRRRTPGIVQGLIRNPMLAKNTPMKTAATGVMWRETRGPYSV